ncbi:T9SS type A sorting domain-containing protein [bacterium]|nr:T9SS type A sorting domain-containing protein [bacterium]
MSRKTLGVLLLGFVMLFTGVVAQAGNVTFRVNMNQQMELGNFTPVQDLLVLRGDFNGWGGTEPEMMDPDSDGIFTANLFLEPGDYGYKHVILVLRDPNEAIWETIPNRSVTVTEEDQVIDIVWFNDVPGDLENVNADVTFQVDMSVPIFNGQFDPESDQVVIRGGHPTLGNWAGEVAVMEDAGDGLFSNSFTFDNIPVETPIEFKYVIIPDGNPDLAEWETSPNRSFQMMGDEPDVDEDGDLDVVLAPVNFSDLSIDDIIQTDTNVIFEVDMRPAYYKLDDPSSGGIEGVEQIETVEIAGYFNGWPWENFDEWFQLHDDGVYPDDVAGDSMFTVQLQFNAGSQIHQIYKYAINGLDVEAGFDQNHSIELDDTTDPNFTHDTFGEPGTWYEPWIYWILPQYDFEVYFSVDVQSFVDAGFGDPDTMLVGVRGGPPELGSWETTIELTDVEGTVYSGWITIHGLRAGTAVEFKYQIEDVNAEHNYWEADENRVFYIEGEEVDTDEDGLLEVTLETVMYRVYFPPTITPIYDIQFVEDPATDDASPWADQDVIVEGWVTFDPISGGNTRFFMADAAGAWNGIYVYVPGGLQQRMGVGWYVRVSGYIQEYFGLTELVVEDQSNIQVFDSAIHWDNPPAALAYTTVSMADMQGASAEAYESCLIRFENVITTAEPGNYGEWFIGDESGNSFKVDNPMSENGYMQIVTLDKPYDYVQGPLNYSYDEYKLLPEIAHDLKVATNIENGWFDSVPYIQQLKWHDIVVHRNEGVDEYRNDQSYASAQRYGGTIPSESVVIHGFVTLEPGIGNAPEGAVKFLIADAAYGINDIDQLRSWSSVVVYAPDASVVPDLAVGDEVIIEGVVGEYEAGVSNLTELMVYTDGGSVTNLGSFPGEWYPKSYGLGQVWDYWYAEMHEGVVVHTGGGEVVNTDMPYSNMLMQVDDFEDEMPAVLVGADSYSFRDGSFPTPINGRQVLSITGWINNNFGLLTPQYASESIFRIEPRYHSDIEYEGSGGEQHFWPVPETGLPYAIVVASATFGEGELPPGSEIAVFDGDLCVGMEIVDNYPVSITAWQGDASQGLDGFTPGNDIIFRAWVHGDMMEYPASATYIQGDGTFGFGVGSNVDLDVQQEITIQQPLQGGRYELISTPLWPQDLAIENLTDMLEGLQIVYEDNGDFYWPAASVNNIGEINVTEGYRVFVTNDQMFPITGMPLDPNTGYALANNRWNWMGYPFLEEHPVEAALSEIGEQLIIVMNDDGLVYWPEASVNTLGNLVPGTGYQVFVSDPVFFSFNQSMPSKAGMPMTEITVLQDAPAPTGLPYPVLVSWDEALDADGVAAVELYNGDLMVGKGAAIEGRQAAYITAWGGDDEHGLEGFTRGQNIKVRLIGEDGTELPLKAESSNAKFGEGAGARISVERAELPTEFTVSNGYPNPFNPSITIPFGLPEGGEVTFTLYNLLGQRVAKQNLVMKAGYHRHIMQARPNMVSGVYFLRVDFGSATKMQKIMLLK